jgi:hypothetical protein
MPLFARGLARVGARVYGVGDQPEGGLPDVAHHALAGYIQTPNLWNEDETVALARRMAASVAFDRVECLWEPGILLAARVREALGIPGMKVEQAELFRDKEKMKRALDEAGLRTPHHRRAATVGECREAAEEIGFPLIIKPIAGAGSADTYRVNDTAELETILGALGHVAEVSVEEFIDGEEYTFDTVSVDGEIAYFNVSWYRPRPLIARTVEWISPQTLSLRRVDDPKLAPGIELGKGVLKALGFRTGFTHMEWFLKPDGEAVFGEIGARPPGARSVDLMNYASDIDLFTGWGEAVALGSFTQRLEREYNSAVIFKRAQGRGRIQRIDGLELLAHRFGDAIVAADLLPVGAHRRDWKQTLLSDGWVFVRHPDLGITMEIADRVGVDLQMYAG